MRLDSIAADLGFDMRLKLILSRVGQLVKQEATALVESKSLTYSLQRKVSGPLRIFKSVNTKQLCWLNEMFFFSVVKVTERPAGEQRTPHPAPEEEGFGAGGGEEEPIRAGCGTRQRSSGGEEAPEKT